MDLNILLPYVYAVIAIISTFFLWSRHSRRVQRNVEAQASSPPSSSSPPVREDRFQYDVFLSFRGPDTRNGFTGFLHNALKEKGIITFIDNEKLEKGQKVLELFDCIQRSQIFVPIFSKGYAHSKWCLKEIAKMVECRRLIIPVFFDVEPRDVKEQTGPFEDAFRKWHKNKNIEKKEVSTWRAALRKAGEVSGFNLATDTNGDQAKLVQLIVKRVLKEVNKTPLPVAKHPIGLDSRIGEVMELLNVDAREEVKIVGIHAMGGMGKTTLAKAVYNQTYTLFDGCIFVKNIRGEAAKSGLVSLQEEILRDAFNDKNVNVNNIDDGSGKIKQRILSKKVLLILDDVDDESQVDALTGGADRNQICPGSRIIITTRDKKVLTASRVKDHEVYELKGLDPTQSLQLFSWHAFGKEEPTDEFAELSKEVSATATGLPLALEIFGRLCSDLTQVEEWKEMLKKLKKNQNKDIHKKLKISYDVLDKELKEIFLDIACFFIGEGRNLATLMWDDCEFFPHTTIKTLVSKSLVKIDDKTGEFEMHDQIRDMGRKIIQDESPASSRLWMDGDEILDVLEGTKNVEAIQLIWADYSLSTTSLATMSKLRMLRLGYRVRLNDIHKHFPKNLLWLEWHPDDLDSLPDGLHLENIVVLDLSKSSITQLWDRHGASGFKVFQKLKVLNLSRCEKLTSCPDFASMPYLQELDLSDCIEMTELHQSIGRLQRLTHLSLYSCENLEKLPVEVWQLTSLKKLELSSCHKITALPSQMGDCKSFKQLSLKVLNLKFCIRFTTCPDFTRMPHLETLKFEGCYEMSEFSPSIGKLKSLTKLSLNSCKSLKELPKEIWQLSSLEKLDLRWCEGITTWPSHSGDSESLNQLFLGNKLKVLHLDGCGNLTTCPDFTRMPHLKTLGLEGCKSLKGLPGGIWQLTSLESLDLSRCSQITALTSQLDLTRCPDFYGCENMIRLHPSIQHLTSLSHLNLSGCKSLKELPQLPPSLITLNAGYCNQLEKIENVSNLKGLEDLKLSGCGRLVDISGIQELNCLKRLEVNGCENLTTCPDFTRMPHLETLNFDGCKKMSEFSPSIGKLKSLTKLSLNSCKSLKELPKEIWQLSSLEEFDLSYCEGITMWPSLSGDSESLKQLFLGNKLKVLTLKHCENLKTSPDFTRMPHLETLDFECCYEMSELSPSIGKLKRLTNLSLIMCKSLKELPKEIWKLSSLEKLDLCGCKGITMWPSHSGDSESLKQLFFGNKLKVLRLDYCENLTTCPDFTRMPHLKELGLSGFKSLKGLPGGMWQLTSLEWLDLSRCSQITALTSQLEDLTTCPDLTRMTHLKTLILSGCKSLKELPQLPPSLITLYAEDCDQLEKIENVSNLKGLQDLNLSGCGRLVDIPGIQELKCLKRLKLQGCRSLCNSFFH